jgi:hypothetical protein
MNKVISLQEYKDKKQGKRTYFQNNIIESNNDFISEDEISKQYEEFYADEEAVKAFYNAPYGEI